GWPSPTSQQYLAQAHTQDFLEHMSSRGWDAWGPARSSAACVVRGVSAVLSGKCHNALCLVETPGRHAPSGACSVGHGGRAAAAASRERLPCSVNSVAIGALYAHFQWAVGRVVVLDLHSHLATGTADILCRTLDPAFLYATIAPTGGGGRMSGPPAHEHALRLVQNQRKSITRANDKPLLTRKVLQEEGGALWKLSVALEAFRPDLVMISSGVDGRRGHSCGLGDLVAEDYEWFTREV
ncbi:unnamed protein product, partial [Sphacelaria rigidula]